MSVATMEVSITGSVTGRTGSFLTSEQKSYRPVLSTNASKHHDLVQGSGASKMRATGIGKASSCQSLSTCIAFSQPKANESCKKSSMWGQPVSRVAWISNNHVLQLRRRTRVPPTVKASFLEEMLQNKITLTATAACLFAQGLKPFTAALAGQGFNWKLAVKSGGMPSSHSAVVTSIAAAMGLTMGPSDPVFGALIVYACIVMYDAQGVRRAVGKQAEVLNTLVVPDLARRTSPPLVRQPHPMSAAPAVPPPSAIGVELAQDARKAELDFLNNGMAGSAQPSFVSSTAGTGSPIGVELVTSGPNLELAFLDRREGSEGDRPTVTANPPASPASPSPQSSNTETGEASSGTTLASAPAERPSPDSDKHRKTASSSNGNPRLNGYGNGNGNVNRALEKENGVSGKLRTSIPLNRSQEFWAAAAREPSMQEGEVVQQELGQMEGWRHIPLKESVGHTKPQVFTGAVAGVVLALILDSLGFYR